MKLISIKSHGFKSFAEKIEINLNGGITGIVGPNGSGKSNIVDAVKWVYEDKDKKLHQWSEIAEKRTQKAQHHRFMLYFLSVDFFGNRLCVQKIVLNTVDNGVII